MKPKITFGFLVIIVALMVAACTAMPAKNQQITGELGSPSATTTISGKQLPAPDPAFGGVIKKVALDSKPWWAPRIVPPKKAPNVLLIITDDSGFGVPSTFGGVIRPRSLCSAVKGQCPPLSAMLCLMCNTGESFPNSSSHA